MKVLTHPAGTDRVGLKMFTALEFFAGSGLVRLGLAPQFETLWANDNCAKKRATYIANHPSEQLLLAGIQDVKGTAVPTADLAWASFPCQDLSLAGNMSGMTSGTRSGLFWEWIRVLTEMHETGNKPSVVVAENVVGFVSAENGKYFHQAYRALRHLGYRVGAVVVDADLFVPQSRRRVFIIGVERGIPVEGLIQDLPSAPFHPANLIRTSFLMDDPEWLWWSLPATRVKRKSFADLCERSAPCDSPARTEKLCAMLSPINRKKLDIAIKSESFFAGTAYKRTRPDANGDKVQRLEIRFDGTAGCLRTPNGGSSRQTVIVVDKGQVRSRLMTVRECARLMGAPDSFKLQGSYNDGYRAMGDAVAVPVTRWLARYLLAPLVERSGAGSYQASLMRSLHLADSHADQARSSMSQQSLFLNA